MTLPVSEIFGPTIQGEGPRAGRLCHFIRLGGCNLSCSWCDTPYSWDSSRFDLRQELTPLSVDEICDQLEPDINEVVITGGEPFMHQRSPYWGELLRKLKARNNYIAVETNGTIAPNEVTQTFVSHYSVSPKLENAGEHKRSQDRHMAVWPNSLKTDRACLKFVVCKPEDIFEAVQISEMYGWPRWNTWVMPEGTSSGALLDNFRAITEEAIRQRVNVSQRIHVFAFGDERGT